MSGLLYYLPGKGATLTLDQLSTAGLSHTFDSAADYSLRGCSRGPDGEAGFVIGDTRRTKLAYLPERQGWRRVPGGPAWVGFYSDARPDPDELARRRRLRGHLVELGDGQKYLCPVARGWQDDEDPGPYIALPSVVGIDDETGDWSAEAIDPHYEHLWTLACTFWDGLTRGAIAGNEQGGESVEIAEPVNLFDAALTVLACNYRIGKAECALLGLFSEPVCQEILMALVDWPTIELVDQKKRRSENSNSTAGAPAAQASTAQP